MITFNINSIFLCLLLHIIELINDMHATTTAGINNQINKTINHMNKKSLTISPTKQKVRNNTQKYCIAIQIGLSVSFIA